MRTTPLTFSQKARRVLLGLSLVVNPGTALLAGLWAGQIAMVLVVILIIIPRIT